MNPAMNPVHSSLRSTPLPSLSWMSNTISGGSRRIAASVAVNGFADQLDNPFLHRLTIEQNSVRKASESSTTMYSAMNNLRRISLVLPTLPGGSRAEHLTGIWIKLE